MFQPDRMQRAAASYVAPQLDPNEQIEGILGDALTGISWWVLLIAILAAAVVVVPFAITVAHGPIQAAAIGALAAGLMALVLFATLARSYAVVATSQRLMLLRRSPLTGRISAMESHYARAGVRVLEFKPGSLFGSLKLGLPDGHPVTFSFRRVARRGAEQIAMALNTPLPTAAG